MEQVLEEEVKEEVEQEAEVVEEEDKVEEEGVVEEEYTLIQAQLIKQKTDKSHHIWRQINIS